MAKLTKEAYLSHLNDINSSLEDFLRFIDSGKTFYIRDISLKLRILYCKKSRTEPLVKKIQDLYGFIINVLVKYSIKTKVEKGVMSESLLNGLVVQQINSVNGWFESGNELVSIFDAINKKDEVLLEGKLYSYKEIFENIADKMGGAHIDESVADEKLAPHSKNLLIGGLSIADRAVYDTARATIILIRHINTFIVNNKETHFIKHV